MLCDFPDWVQSTAVRAANTHEPHADRILDYAADSGGTGVRRKLS